MKKIKWTLSVLTILSVLLTITACQPEKTPTPEAIVEATQAPIATATPGAVIVADTAVPTEAALIDLGEPDLSPPEIPGTCESMPLPELPLTPVTDEDRAMGADEADAEYILIEYSDFLCSGCSGMAPIIKLFVEEHPNIRLVYRHFPLSYHELAPLGAEAAEAAGEQGKFWEMHDLLFGNQASWGAADENTARDQFTAFAEELGLDVDQFNSALDNGTYTAKVQANYEEALALGLPGTPSLIFNNILFPTDMGLSYQSMASFMEILETQDTLFYENPPDMITSVDESYEATFTTSKGDVIVELFPATSPLQVNSFVFLAEEHWYDGSPFFFVQEDFVAVTGDPTGTSVGYPGYVCTGEERLFHGQTGLVWMMGNGQLFFTLGDAAYENLVTAAVEQGYEPAQFSLIGQVTEGQDVLDSLATAYPAQLDTSTDVLESVTISRQ